MGAGLEGVGLVILQSRFWSGLEQELLGHVLTSEPQRLSVQWGSEGVTDNVAYPFLLSFSFLRFIFIFCVWVICLRGYHLHVVPVEARRGHQVL